MSYVIEVSHDGLGKHRVITGSNPEIVRSKARAQGAEWEAQFAKLREKQRVQQAKDMARHDVAEKLEQAAEETQKAQAAREELSTLLASAVARNQVIDWESLKETSVFPKEAPTGVILLHMPREPLRGDLDFQPELGLLDKLIKSRGQAKVAAMAARFGVIHGVWEKEVAHVQGENDARMKARDEGIAAYQAEKSAFEADIVKKNAAIDEQRQRYQEGDPGAIHDYCDLVLSRSVYPDSFPKEWDIECRPDVNTLIVDYKLPAPDQIPTAREVKYIKGRDEFKTTEISQKDRNDLYDEVLYQVCLRTLYELFMSDTIGALDAIGFNGMVTSVSPATGQVIIACVLSVHVTRKEFELINWRQVDPKACFRSLKGIGSSKLHSITPVAPILKINREDKRFIPAQAVADGIDPSFNLAAMDWEDFEHLIREVFEAEFKSTGGEVKVTQASRDGGVDAVAFDPDPIRGGKIVIQAKRYTNTVGVAAVRDLYGTLMNEGANKGILVTTSDFGPDAYEFAKNKPLTLMNGGNLLYLLEKHGHRAKIDLREAKLLLGENVSAALRNSVPPQGT